jgi:hypothetical protein
MSERSSLLNRLNENTQFINRGQDDEAVSSLLQQQQQH